MAANNKQRILVVPRPVCLVGRDYFVSFVFSKYCYFYNKLVIGLRVVQFCLLSLLVIFKITRNDDRKRADHPSLPRHLTSFSKPLYSRTLIIAELQQISL